MLGQQVPARYRNETPGSDSDVIHERSTASLEDHGVEQTQLLDHSEFSTSMVAPVSLHDSVFDVTSDSFVSGKRKRTKISNVWKYYRFTDHEKTDFTSGGRVECIFCG